MKVEAPYLIVMLVAIGFGVYYYFKGSVHISAVHTLFLLAGGILTAVIFIISPLLEKPVEIGLIDLPNFTLATALGNITLGLPYLRGAPVSVIQLQPTEILVAIASEEIFRIGAAVLLGEAFGKGTGVLMSGIVFALMHMFWNPTQWFIAIFGGAILSALLFIYESQLAGVVTHYGYDLVAFGYITPILFFAVSIPLGVIAYAFIRRRK